MSVFRVIEVATGRTVYAYSAEQPADFAEYPAAQYTHVAAVDVRADGSVPPDPQWTITKRAFRARFTTAEKVAIEIASLDNPAASMPDRANAAALRAYQADVVAAAFVDLQHADTVSGVRALESFGLIATGRADVILLTQPTADELAG